jgi:leader peptidase (prepilin peptidase)/N-methyltransferase
MIQALRKTRYRSYVFLRDALAWRIPERQYAVVGWALIVGTLLLLAKLAYDPRDLFSTLIGLYLVLGLTAVCAIDARYGIIPNGLVIGLALGGLLQTYVSDQSELLDRAFDAILVYGVGIAFKAGYRWARGYEGFGLGDVKFVAAGALWIDIENVSVLLLIAVLSAFVSLSVLRADCHELEGRDSIPFGPHLAMGLWATWILAALPFNN